MKDESNVTPSLDPDGPDSDVVSLLHSLQRQVLFLEKKIDLLISQSQEKPRREGPPDRPFRKRTFPGATGNSDRPRRHAQGDRAHGPKRGGAPREPFYEQRPHGRKPGLNPQKKRFSPKRKDRE